MQLNVACRAPAGWASGLAAPHAPSCRLAWLHTRQGPALPAPTVTCAQTPPPCLLQLQHLVLSAASVSPPSGSDGPSSAVSSCHSWSSLCPPPLSLGAPGLSWVRKPALLVWPPGPGGLASCIPSPTSALGTWPQWSPCSHRTRQHGPRSLCSCLLFPEPSPPGVQGAFPSPPLAFAQVLPSH